ncbi:hypothetical protein SAMN05421853_10296 [Roseivivax halotolerans]|uniref:ArsR family transcriptional regulator n=1 Tax=Roseivivax halotolerans TaxID=93684 RepID=A0A1I5W316_9RHOB|nr:hypothetical protein [Roseivivax halotolerans]SFQ14115.1 hypothetical protein SAMN05421853_10296 [Roseivivax halotolerans]
MDNETTLHRRLAILRHLEKAADYTANSSILLDVVRGVGVSSTEDQLRSALAWLDEQELITLTDLETVSVATATTRGVDVALGRALHPGVKRPSPRG